MVSFPLFRRSQVAAATLLLALGTPVIAAAQSLVPSFDWSVPDRMTANGMKGVKLPFAGVGANQTNANMRILNPERAFGSGSPAGWPASMNACASSGTIATYQWFVDGLKVAESTACKGTTLRFPREGRYRVGLTVVATSGATASVAQDVNIQDWLIIGLGDSYASGEGNPNIDVKPQGYINLDNARKVLADALAVLDDGPGPHGRRAGGSRCRESRPCSGAGGLRGAAGRLPGFPRLARGTGGGTGRSHQRERGLRRGNGSGHGRDRAGRVRVRANLGSGGLHGGEGGACGGEEGTERRGVRSRKGDGASRGRDRGGGANGVDRPSGRIRVHAGGDPGAHRSVRRPRGRARSRSANRQGRRVTREQSVPDRAEGGDQARQGNRREVAGLQDRGRRHHLSAAAVLPAGSSTRRATSRSSRDRRWRRSTSSRRMRRRP